MKPLPTILLVLVSSFCLQNSVAQSYTTAVGVRLGTGIGLTMQQVILPQWTLEGILQKRAGEYSTHYSLLAEHHRKLLGKRLNFYLGAGVQGGILEGDLEQVLENPIGLAGVGGLEFTIKRLNISADFMPEYNIRGGSQKLHSSTAVSLRYVLIKAPKKNKEKIKRKKQKAKAKAKEKKEKQKQKTDEPKKFNWKIWKKKG